MECGSEAAALEPEPKAVAVRRLTDTALQGAFGAAIFKAGRDSRQSKGPTGAKFALTVFLAGCNLAFNVAPVGTFPSPFSLQGGVSVGKLIGYNASAKRWPAGKEARRAF
jgi:hypothetical protein